MRITGRDGCKQEPKTKFELVNAVELRTIEFEVLLILYNALPTTFGKCTLEYLITLNRGDIC